MQKPLLEIQNSQGVYESCHPETEVSQIVDFDSYVDGKDNTILSSAKSYADTKKTEAINAAATDATTKANNAKTSAINDAKQYFNNVTTDGGIFTFTRGDGTTQAVTVVADNAAAHNAIYRGKDLTDAWKAGTVSGNIQNGTFRDIFVGDYINMPIVVDGVTYQVKWEVADLDYYLHTGDQECTAHHALMFPSKTIQTNVQMNSTDTTAGGYVGSAMWKTVIPKYSAAIQAAFGSDHVLKHRELLTDSLNTTVASAGGFGWTGCAYWGSAPWYDALANIPNEVMIYGCAPASSGPWDVGNASRQLAIYRFKHFSEGRLWFWLRAVASSALFAVANGDGEADANPASFAVAYGGVRPYFLLY